MSDKKYYTPELKDFSYGLIYQIQSSSLTPSEDDWSDLVYDEGDDEMSFSTIGGLIREGSIRVQYLSKEDIVSCGWKYVEDDSVGDGNFRWYDLFEIGNIRLSTFGHMDDPKWQHESDRVYIYKFPDATNTNLKRETMFEGTIKNKSELLTLMKQLGIEIKNDNQ